MPSSDAKTTAAVVAALAGLAVAAFAVVQLRNRAVSEKKKSVLNSQSKTLDVVGGHGSKKGKGAPILVIGSQIYKPFQAAQKGKAKSRGEQEADFYRDVNARKLALKPFIPAYFGVEEIDGVSYLKLDNLLAGIKDACILDLKMGQQTYDESASPEKIARERAKYPPQEIIGFRCSGMKVVRPKAKGGKGDTWSATRDWCMSLVPETMQESIERFFFDGESIKLDLVKQLLDHLEQIDKMLHDNPMYRFYGSSLLIVYDASSAKPELRIKMIDFAHVFPIQDGGLDDGYLHGVKFLGNCLRLTLASALAYNNAGSVASSGGAGGQQVGGHGNIDSRVEGQICKKDSEAGEGFDIEAAFYRKAQGADGSTPDALSSVMPRLIRVDTASSPRELVLSDAAALVRPRKSLSSPEEFSVSVMDIKLGIRSFRSDCPNAPAASYFNKYATFEQSLEPGHAEECWKSICGSPDGPKSLAEGKLGKRDYLSFRDATTTSAELGFRLTALVHGEYRVSQSDSRSISSRIQFLERLEHFLYNERGFDTAVANCFIDELGNVQQAVAESHMFKKYELVGSSLLFLHCNGKAAIRWIDFANSTPSSVTDHNGIVQGIQRLTLALQELTEKYSS